jgi:hemerythrin
LRKQSVFLRAKLKTITAASRSAIIGTSLFSPVNPHAPEQDLSVGIPEIDDEHRRFFIDIQALDDALRGTGHMTDVQSLMAALIENALGHFAHEEQLFEQFGFPDLASHAHAHDHLATELIGLKQAFEATNLNRKWLEVGAMLRSLLLNHILHDDMKYRDFLNRYRLLPTR